MLNVLRLLSLVVALAVGLSLTAPAALAAKHEAGAKKEEDALAFTGYQRWDLAIYTVIVFGLVFYVLSKYAFPLITSGLKKREDLIASAKDEALKAKAEAEEMRKKLQDEFTVANDKIRGLMEEARRDADALRAKEREAGTKEAAAERERAKREIEAARDAALQEIYQKSVDLATLISAKAIRRNMSQDDHKRLLDESLAEIKTGRI